MAVVTRLEHEIGDLLAAQTGVPRYRIDSESRLVEDLGLQGEDADAFFAQLTLHYPVDLTAMLKRWDRYFVRKRFSLVAGVAMLAALGVAAAIASWIGGTFHLGRAETAILTVLLAVGLVALIEKIRPTLRNQPIRVRDIAAAVTRGHW